MQAIEAVVFDIGGVLLDWNPRYLYRRLFDDEDGMERFLAEVCTLEWHTAHDLGVPYAQSCAALARQHPEQADLIWAWGRRSEEMIGGPITGTVEILRELRAAGVPCYALTNMEAETYPLRRDRYDFMSWFQGTVVSSYERVAKPDPEIFHRLLDRFALRAETTLLIDDSQRNVDAARELGMPAIRFQSPAQVRRYLEQSGLLSAAGAIRPCRADERAAVLEIINAAAEAYREVIPADRWHEPYMAPAELDAEIADGVRFSGYEVDGRLLGVMGIQPVRDVALIRHAYVRPAAQGRGVGAALLAHLRATTSRQVLVGTWAAADWAVRFYQRHGFTLFAPPRGAELLRAYWDISERQIETSVVLGSPARD